MVNYSQTNQFLTYEQVNLINDFRALWSDVIIWLRSYAVSVLTEFSDVNAIRNRIARITDELNQKLQPFFGVEQAAQFQQLFLLYLLHADSIISAMKDNDRQAADSAVVALYKDADNMADFLARINPDWSRDQWQNLFYQLTETGIAEIIALYSGDYEKEISIRSRLLKLALVLGDYMASGVINKLSDGIHSSVKGSGMSGISQNQDTYLTYGQMNLISDFRSLWSELVLWIRSYMGSILTGFSDSDAIRGQLNRISVEMKQKLEPFLGTEPSDRFQYLLNLYLYHIQDLVGAQKENDQQAMESAVAQIYNDTDGMSDFLSQTNPYWSKDQWQNLLDQQNELIVSQLTALVSGEYEREIEIRDRGMKLALVLGDYMAHGVLHFLRPVLLR
ncbi:MAG: hypothetical protein PHC91_04025 [Eubacteriales bacterium]|nr:hypothetical protein [Eubacteriales bacterium]